MSKQKQTGNVIQVGNLILDLRKTTLNKGGSTFHLTPKETKLMAVLMENVGQVVSRDKIMQEVWYTDNGKNSRTLDVHIRWLRQKIEDNPKIPEYILTRKSKGYELRVADDE